MKLYQKIIKPFYKDFSKLILDTVFPITCLSCEAEGALICTECQAQLSKAKNQICIACKKPTPFGLTHSYCKSPQNPDALITVFDYHDKKVAKIVIFAKYSFLPKSYEILGNILSTSLLTDFSNLISTENLVLTPIPLHKWRKRWRGFNQAQILCNVISQNLNIPVMETLNRIKFTKTQKNLKKEQRLKNIQSAFEIISKTDIKNKNIILIDDVTTTGATLQEATKILKRNGANKVFCLTVARD